jgi:hypothetical protein
MKWLSRQTRLSAVRWPVMLGLVSAAVLGLGAAAGSPASAASASPQSPLSPAALAGSSHVPASRTGGPSAPGTPRGVCSKTARGRLASCPKQLSKNALPAGARNSAIVSQTPSNLAALVDTRTWTSGGGNTFPGADVPFGMVQ